MSGARVLSPVPRKLFLDTIELYRIHHPPLTACERPLLLSADANLFPPFDMPSRLAANQRNLATAGRAPPRSRSYLPLPSHTRSVCCIFVLQSLDVYISILIQGPFYRSTPRSEVELIICRPSHGRPVFNPFSISQDAISDWGNMLASVTRIGGNDVQVHVWQCYDDGEDQTLRW